VTELSRIFHDLEVFEKAESLVEKSRKRAEELTDSVESLKLKQLLHFFIDSVLTPEESETEPTPELVQLPIV
jgi:geranylgeranyl diphosphate synthase, type II